MIMDPRHDQGQSKDNVPNQKHLQQCGSLE